MAHQKMYKIRLHVISPVHIGCDDVYEPTGFAVDKTEKKLIAFDPLDFVQSLSSGDRAKFMALCDKGTLESIVEIYKFMWNVQALPPGHQVEVSDGFIETYERVATRLQPRDAKQELNKFLISRTSYLPADNSPYIPGSALKGSLRTGWLNRINSGSGQKKAEKDLIEGSFATDPFRMVKVGDLIPVTPPQTTICFAVNKKKKPSKHEPRGPQQILEVVLPESAIFEGTITLHSQEQGSEIRRPVPAGIDFFAGATAFFDREMGEEEAILRTIDLPAGIGAKMKRSFGDRYLKTVFPVRLGRHSGAECLTINGMRNIKIKGKNNEYTYGPHSTTVWLAGDQPKASSGLLPFGWAALEVLEADPANIWTQRVVTERPAAASAAMVVEPVKPAITSETIVWEAAILIWSPGNSTLSVSCNGKKAELKLAGDRSIVPAELHRKLFDKKDAVKAKVSLEKSGNSFAVTKVELLS